MSEKLPNGAILSIATAFASALTVSAATNANGCELTVTNTLADGEYVEYVCGWTKATNRIFRVDAADSDSIVLEGLDTSNTTLFPAGGGVGTIRKINTWQQLSKISNFAMSGGDIQTTTEQYLEDDFETEYTTVISAMAFTFDIADDVTNAGYLALKTISDVQGDTALMVSLKNGNKNLYKVGVFQKEDPSMEVNTIMKVSTRLSIKNKVVRYAS
ncbi:phage tail tube protein [Methylophilus sp.]|uniref:phage tail tube protein n=1 Tax=Methylophilus sp. TaxID=29541 RepID=UPI000D4E9E5A|nr:phage tail tube protein [Methylophilus sp.]PPD12166.1 MAG: phage tail protein [Methylophilus sp.]